MKKVLVIGASGLIGHTMMRELQEQFEVTGTLHKPLETYNHPFFKNNYHFIDNIDVEQFDVLKGIIKAVAPDVILNCVGITRRKVNEENYINVININACFPHRLVRYAAQLGIKVIHFSTDCVFNGNSSNYTEESLTTAEDLYGRTKAMGEIRNYENGLTLRSSFIGQELFDKTELLDWFLAQGGKTITGYKKTLYSGITTIFLTKIVANVISNHPKLSGLYQIAPDTPISKYDLLMLAKQYYNINVEITPDVEHVHTPTLIGSKFKAETAIEIPDWKSLMSELSSHKNEY